MSMTTIFRALAGASLLALAACTAPDAIRPTQTAMTTETEIPRLDYEKFTLDNGLEVILHRDSSDPIVAVTTVIHAGSNREKPGRTGFAHFFEHMAFNDSENVPRGWNRKKIPEWGGSRNGGTWSDGTIYYEVVPKDAFDKILWIDSDRLGYMINTVTVEALEREKQVVKNEKRQRYDNAAYGYTSEVIKKALYPQGHPYSWTTIGLLPDLQAATLQDLKEFYTAYYGAANATLAIAGDIDIEETKGKVQRWFGEIRRGPDVPPLSPMPVTLSETRKLFWEDDFAKLPELRLTFPTVEAMHEDEAALNVLADLLAGTKNAPLYREIVERQKLAPSVSGYNNSMEIAGEFVLRVRAKAGTDLDDVEAAIGAALAQFETDGVNEGDLARIKAEQETSLYLGLSTVLGKSRQLATGNTFAGDPLARLTEARQLSAVTAEDVMRVYRDYIKDRHSIMTSFVPEGAPDLAVAGSTRATVWVEEVTDGKANEEVSAGDVANFEKTPSKYDRSEPDFGPLPLIQSPAVWQAELPGGAPLLGIESDEIPIVTFDLVLDGGGLLDPVGGKGTVALLARLMNEGTATKTPAELEQAIGILGSSIQVSAGSEAVTLRGTTLARNFEETVALAREMLLTPRFEEAEFDRVRSAALTAIDGRAANANQVASMTFSKLIYGKDHPNGLPLTGTRATVEAMTLDDLTAMHSRLLASPARLHIVGDVTPARAQSALTPLAGSLTRPAITAPLPPTPAQTKAGTVYFVDIPDAKQSVLYIGRLAVEATHPDAKRLDYVNEKLGGGISGDLAQMLRIEKGYTYGAYSYVGTGRMPQPFRIVTSVRANATGASLEVIRDMLAAYPDTLTPDAIDVVQQKLIKENTRAFESLGAKLGTLRQISKYGKPLDFVEQEQADLLAMTPEEFQAMSKKYLSAEDMVWVVVGDKTTQLDAVQAFAGGNVVVLD